MLTGHDEALREGFSERMAGVGKLFSRRKKAGSTADDVTAGAESSPGWADSSPPWRAYSPRRSPASLRHHPPPALPPLHQQLHQQRHSARSHSSVRSAVSFGGAAASPNAAGIRHVASTASLRGGAGAGGAGAGGGGGAVVHARSPSATSLGSVFEAEGRGGASVDPGDVSRLTADVRLFTDALGKLRDVFSNPDGGEESRRQAGHARLGELLLALKRTLSRHPALSLREILSATGALISRVKGYPYERCIGADEQKQGMMQAVDSLALAFSNSVTEFLMGDSEGAWSTLRQQHSRSLENLSGDKEEECGAEGRDDKEDPAFATGPDSEQLDERLHSCDGGIDAALAYAKSLSKYIHGLAGYVERRLAVDIDYSKDLMKLAQCPMPAFTHEPPMPLQGIYASLMEQDWETAHAAAHTAAQLQADKCVLPLRNWREEHERKRKELKELWQKGQRRLAEAECSLKKARQVYSQRREELEKARGSAARAEEGLAAVTSPTGGDGAGSAGSSRTLERKRKTEEDALRKAEEADTVFRASAKELRLRRQEVQAVKTVVLAQVRELARRADLALKTVTAAYFELLGTQAAALPARYRALHEGTDAYVAGTQYAAFARRLAERAPSPPAARDRKLGRMDSGGSEQCSIPSPRDAKGSLKLNGKGEAARGRSWLVGGVSDTDSGSGSSESRSLDSPSASPGDFIRKLPRTPSTGTMSSVDDLDDTEPCSPADGDMAAAAMAAAAPGVGPIPPGGPDGARGSASPFSKAPLSEAARSHRLRKLRAPSRCRACDTLVYFQGAECQECLLACHKKCLDSLAVRCPRQRRTAPAFPAFPASPVAPTTPDCAGTGVGTGVGGAGSGVPEPVRLCVSEIERRAMMLKGIYRVNGVKSRVERLCQAMEGARAGSPPDLQQASPHDVSNVLKLYLRQLPEPIIPGDLYHRFIRLAHDGPGSPGSPGSPGPGGSSPGRDSPPPPASPLSSSPPLASPLSANAGVGGGGAGGVAAQLKALLARLPEPNRATLEYIVAHLHRVSRCEKDNKMSAGNLGIVFGPTLMRSRAPSSAFGSPCGGPLSSLADYPSQARVVQLLISLWPSLAPADEVAAETRAEASTPPAPRSPPRPAPAAVAAAEEAAGADAAPAGNAVEEPFTPVRVVQVKLSRINMADARHDRVAGAASPPASGTFRSTLVRCQPAADSATVLMGQPCELTVSRLCDAGARAPAPAAAGGVGEPAGGRRSREAAPPREFDVDGRADFV